MRGYGDFEAEKEAVVRRQSRGGPNIFLLLHVFATAKQPLNVDSNAPFSPAEVVAAPAAEAKASVASEAASVVLLACACLRLCGCALLGTFYTRSSSSTSSTTPLYSTLTSFPIQLELPFSTPSSFFSSQWLVAAAAVDRQSFDMHESPDE